MAKTKISEYSSTANSNTDIASINIDEGCAPSGINNAIRALMAQLKDFQTGAAGDPVTVGDVLTVKGASINDTNGNELFKLTATASAVNELTIANAATGGSPTISATGGDTNIGINLTPKGTGGVVFPAGAVGTPSITTSGDLNTGVYFPAADTVGITTGGTERVRVDSSGNVGVGVTPSAWGSSYKALEFLGNSFIGNIGGGTQFELGLNFYRNSSGQYIYKTTAAATYYEQYAGTHAWLTAASGTAGNTVSFTQAMTLDSSGNLLVGTTSAISKVTVKGGITTQGTSGDATGAVSFYNPSGTKYWEFTTNQGTLFIADADFSHYAYLLQNMTSWGFGSDRRMKKDIVDLDYGLDAVMAMKPKRYTFISSGKEDIGFIAQELKEIVPEAVSGEEIEYLETDTPQERAAKSLGIGKELLIPVLVKAIQEQQAIIEQLQADVAALKGQA